MLDAVLVFAGAGCASLGCAAKHAATSSTTPPVMIPTEAPYRTPVAVAIPPTSPSPVACGGAKENVDPLWRLATAATRDPAGPPGSRTCMSGSRLRGIKAPGAPCEHPNECAPVCCACSEPGRSADASYCRGGKCATVDEVCCAVAGSVTQSCSSP